MCEEIKERNINQLIMGKKPAIEHAMDELSKKADGIYLRDNLKALVIGVSIYRQGKGRMNLPNAARDAVAMADCLREKYGMTDENLCLLAEEVTTAQAEEAIRKVCASLDEKSNLLLYFAGHGEELDGHSYLMCTDSTKRRDENCETVIENAISLQWINEMLKSSPGLLKVRIFDACHSAEVFSKGFDEDDELESIVEDYMSRSFEEIEALNMADSAAASKGFDDEQPEGVMTRKFMDEMMVRERGWITFCGCSIDECSFDLPYIYHGIFTYCLLKGLEGKARRGTGPMYMEDLKIYTCNIVPAIMDRMQHPQYHCELEGNIIVD